KKGVERSIRAMEGADLILLMLDGSEELHDTDRELMEKSNPAKTILVINKTDLPQKIKLSEAHRHTVRVSALKGTGLDELKDTIVETALHGKATFNTTIVTNVRHVMALEKTYASINSFSAGLIKNLSPEFLSVELRDALDAIGEILGTTTPEDILNKIFSNFCIGK
ncbi:MAG: tRNA uridine-5-carboxymethylaminomethyl(34) synthesis GTPase MnmE, partial [Candidatus Roizmanbacteria bacterium]|nr:tRNA uridine-5-carboxymethylaminomethyl(34) synthesis GTPase MnmE [Candidatus Roizmanbacteria bacterium]